jgi:hypothetical protein
MIVGVIIIIVLFSCLPATGYCGIVKHVNNKTQIIIIIIIIIASPFFESTVMSY